jgi:dipeptidyl-peptidase 9
LLQLCLGQARVVRRLALTSGEWEVLPRSVWVDEDHGLVFFLGLRESPLEKHLYVVSLMRPGEVRLLTRPGYSYNIDMNKVTYEKSSNICSTLI